jgi:hypothetical protein
MFDPIQQQAGMTFLRSVANQAIRGALPYPDEPLLAAEPGGHLRRRSIGAGLARFVRIARGAWASRSSHLGSGGQPHGSTAESIQG